MSRQIGTLNRSFSFPSKFQRQSSHISLSALISSPCHHSLLILPRMDSDDSSNTVFNTIVQTSDIDTPDEFQNSEPSPYTFSEPSFRPIHTPTPDESSPAHSSYTYATPILYPMTSDQPDTSSPVTEKLEHELDNFITLQQQLQNKNT